jgi:hypothetical protein
MSKYKYNYFSVNFELEYDRRPSLLLLKKKRTGIADDYSLLIEIVY